MTAPKSAMTDKDWTHCTNFGNEIGQLCESVADCTANGCALERAATEAELASAHLDAERYRWLRNWGQPYQLHDWFKARLSLTDIDAAIDAKIAALYNPFDNS